MSIDWIPTKPARKITPKERGNRGFIPSNKVSGGIMEYESCLERDFFLICNHAPSVKTFQHQPIKIKYRGKKGKNLHYTPDAYVEFTDGSKGLYEIKYEEEVLNYGNKYKERWEETEKWAKARGIIFAVITEKDIRTPRWFNVWFTLGSSKCSSNNNYMKSINILITEQGIRYNELCFILAETLGIDINKSAQIICYAIYYGLVFVDTFSTEQLSKDTIIRKKRNDKSSSFKPLYLEIYSENDIQELEKSEHSKEITFKLVNSKIPLKYEDQVIEREKIVKLWIRQPSSLRTAEWRENFCNKWNSQVKYNTISEKTIYRWVNAYKKDGIEGLIPNHRNAGRPKKYDNFTIECMEKARKLYIKPRGTLKKAYRKLNELCCEKNVPLPPKTSFQYYIYATTTASEIGRKHGIKYHKSHFTPSLASFQGAFMPMQVVQMDNTSFEVFPVDSEEREGLPTPYMTGAIDCYTRMITGFNVSFHPSSARTILEVLVQTILPKREYVDTFETEQDWKIQGFPTVILVDNGMDYRANSVREFCIKYDIIIEFAPIRTPRYKAFIEQWFNILHNALEDENVPATRPLLKYRIENPELKPELDAVLTIQEIEIWLHKWVLDNYHFTNPYEDRQPAPYLRWMDFQDGKTNLILPSPREPPLKKNIIEYLHLSTLERFDRTLRSDGVVWEHLKYNSKELSKIFDVSGKIKVQILLDNRDIRNLWIVNPITENTTLKIRLASGWASTIASLHDIKPINASAWIQEVRLLRRIYKTRITPFLYEKEISRKKRLELLKNSKKTTRSVRKQNEKAKETSRRSITKRIEVPEKITPASYNRNDANIKKEKKQIDWSEIQPAGKRKRKAF